jgi:ubiquinone/menaquinone biosynthesis C-methylase UbiE
MDKQTAQKLINKTRDDYNLIADQFASTRKFNWGDFADAFHSIPLKSGSKVLDLGCGNGRVHELLKDLKAEYYGLDISKELIEHAKKNVPNGHFVIGNLLEIPYHNNKFDLVISLATLHHIPSGVAREQAIKEIYRVTKPGGHILITSWYFWNKPRYVKGIIKATLDTLSNKSELDIGDFMMEWRDGNGKKLTSRYFHAWRKREITKTLRVAGFRDIKAGLYFKSSKKIGNNLIAIARKPE